MADAGGGSSGGDSDGDGGALLHVNAHHVSSSARLVRTVYRAFVAYNTRFALCVVFGVMSYLPLFTNEPDFWGNTLTFASIQNGALYYESSIVCLALVVPLIIDTACDVYNAVTRAPSAKATTKKTKASTDSLTLPEKVLVVVGLIVYPAIAFVPTTTPRFMLIWACCRRAQQMLVFLPIFTSWCRLYPKAIPPFWTTLSILGIGTGQIISLFQANRKYSPVPPANNSTLYALCYVLAAPGLYVLLVLALIWLCRTGWQLLRPAPKAKETFTASRLSSPADGSGRDGEPRDHERDALYFPFIYILLTFVSVIIIGIMSTIFDPDKLTKVHLLLNNIAYIITELCLVNFYLRRVKFEALSSLYALIRSKKQYVRYISHELRTPLNSAFLGLKVVLDDLRDSSDPDDREMCETLTDVQKSCLTAVEILNDLMCFDKIESGILQLHKEDVPAVSFLQECFMSFRAEAIERGVTLDFRVPIAPLPPPDDGTADAASSTKRSGRFRRLSSRLPFHPSSGVAGAVVPTAAADRRKSSVRQAAAYIAALAEAGDEDADRAALMVPLTASDTVHMDKFKANQVVRNLVSNALKFSPRGSTITLKAVFVPDPVSMATGSPEEEVSSDRPAVTAHTARSVASEIRRRMTRGILSISSMPLMAEGIASNVDSDVDEPVEAASSGVRPKPGSPTASPTTTTGVLRVSVVDCGTGISPENQKRLFKEIVQFSPEKLQAGGGSGFGLFITRGIVELHGGQIWVENKGEGHGSTFVVELPMTRKGVRAGVGGVGGGGGGGGVSGSASAATSAKEGPLFDGTIAPAHDALGGSVGRASLRSLSVSLAAPPITISGTAATVSGPPPLATKEEAEGKEPSARGVLAGPSALQSSTRGTAAAAPSADGDAKDDDRPDASTTSLPLTVVEQPPRASPPVRVSGKMRSAKDTAPEGPTYHILVVDDSAMSRKMVVKVLKKDGHTCEEAEDGVDAVAKAKANQAAAAAAGPDGGGGGGALRYGAVLMDFVMPNMDGPDATAALRALGVTCPIFGVTGNTLDMDVERFMTSGATGVYGKPFDSRKFMEDMKQAASGSSPRDTPPTPHVAVGALA